MRFYFIAAVAAVLAPVIASPATLHTVEIINFSVVPQNLAIQAGDSVSWINKDNSTHTITADNNDFDSGDMTSGQTYTTTFKAASNVSYHCKVHPAMTGSVTVLFAVQPSSSSHLEAISPSILLLSIATSFLFLPLL